VSLIISSRDWSYVDFSLYSVSSNGSTNLCNSTPNCNICSILKDGFKVDVSGRIKTMATSGRAHDTADVDP